MSNDDLRLARAYLMRVAEPPATALLEFVDAVGPLEAAERIRAAEVPPRVLAETEARRHLNQAAGDLADAARVGARLVVPEDEGWPAWQLLSLTAAVDRGQRWSGAPLGLWARGPASPGEVFDRAVSVVGARSATSYGEHVAAEVGFGLAAAGMTVVSGAAYGIDGSAHRGALNAEGTTVAVLGCGIDVDYPRGHTNLLSRIAETGLVLSEYPPGTRVANNRLPVRNRLIAALSSATVVVEAGMRSGARNTATTAAALGKLVLAVPGPITSATSVGCHDLLRTGTATLAGSVAHIVEAVGPATTTRSQTVDLDAVAAILRIRHTIPAVIEDTGDARATLYIGPVANGRYVLACGPGTYRNTAHSTADPRELYLAPDDDSDTTTPSVAELGAVTEDRIADLIAHHVSTLHPTRSAGPGT